MALLVNCSIIVSGRLTMTARRDHNRLPRMLNSFNDLIAISPWIGDPIISLDLPGPAQDLTRPRELTGSSNASTAAWIVGLKSAPRAADRFGFLVVFWEPPADGRA